MSRDRKIFIYLRVVSICNSLSLSRLYSDNIILPGGSGPHSDTFSCHPSDLYFIANASLMHAFLPVLTHYTCNIIMVSAAALLSTIAAIELACLDYLFTTSSNPRWDEIR